MAGFGVIVQRWILVGLLPLLAIVFWSGTSDPVNVPKTSLAAATALLALLVGLVRMAALRRITVPLTPALWAALALGAGLLVATLASDVPGASWAGTLGRSDGLLLYGACVALFLVGLRVLEAAAARWMLVALLVGGAFAAAYGLLQKLRLDPIKWADVGISPVIGSFGNPDFESAYLGIVVPAAVWGALTGTWGRGWRAASGALAALCLLVALFSSSVQGLLAGAAGVVVLLVAVLLNRGGRPARLGLGAVGAAAALVALTVVAGVLAGVGPVSRVVGAGSLTARKWYWEAALAMWRQHPLTGVGLDRYGAYYRSVRPAEAAAVSNYSDAAHSVPLHLLATGGLAVAVPYLVVVALVGWALVSGLRRLAGEARLLLGGLGGAWVAYQVQSLVSIDQPALAVTGWLLAAAVVAMGAPPRMQERLLPGAVVPVARKGRGATVPAAAVPVWSAGTVALCAAVAGLGLAGLWLSFKPLRADAAARAAAVAVARGEGNAAYDKLQAATRLAPYQQAYWLQRGKFLEQVKQPALAAQSYAEGARRDPRAYDVLLAGALLAKSQQDVSALARYTSLLTVVDPSGRWREQLLA